MQVTLQLALRPIWEEIDALGGRCMDFLKAEGLHPDAQNALSGAIMPVLMVLPPISDEQTIQDFRQATGVVVEDRDA